MYRLFIVDDVFEIKQRGVIAVGMLDNPQARFRIGDCVEIRRTNGVSVAAEISGIPMGSARAGLGEILLKSPITKEDIGPGDEVWI